MRPILAAFRASLHDGPLIEPALDGNAPMDVRHVRPNLGQVQRGVHPLPHPDEKDPAVDLMEARGMGFRPERIVERRIAR